MKSKIYLISFAILLSFSCNKSPRSGGNKSNNNLLRGIESLNKTFNIGDALLEFNRNYAKSKSNVTISSIFEGFTENKNCWNKYAKGEADYTNNGKIQKLYVNIIDNSNYSKSKSISHYYYKNNNLADVISEVQKNGSKQYYKTSYEYYDDSRLKIRTDKTKDRANRWENSYQYSYGYDKSGKVIEFIYLTWNHITNKWIEDYKEKYFYDKKDTITTLHYKNNGDNLELYMKTDSVYYSNSRLKNVISYKFKADKQYLSRIIEMKYDSLGNEIYEHIYNYEKDFSSDQNNIYNRSGELIEKKIQIRWYNNKSEQIDNYKDDEYYIYDNEGFIKEIIRSYYDDNKSDYHESDRIFQTYK